MLKTFTGQSTILINVPATRVWEALTSPELIKQYLFGTNVTSDWKVGSQIIYSGVWEGKEYQDKGIILKFEPNKLLETNYWSGFSGLPDIPENYHKVSYKLSSNQTQTTLTIIQEDIPTKEARDHSQKNWAMVLKTLKDILEK